MPVITMCCCLGVGLVCCLRLVLGVRLLLWVVYCWLGVCFLLVVLVVVYCLLIVLGIVLC